MNWVDVILLGVIALSAILAFFHGLVREALGVAGWVGAAVVALLARKEIQPFLDPYFTPPWLAEAIGAGVVFLVALIVFKLMINAVADRVQDSALGGVDRVLGLVFGAARGAFLLVVAYIVAGLLLPGERWPEPVLEARALPLLSQGAHRVIEIMPAEYRPRLNEPPLPRSPTVEELLRPPARSRN
jgi:membrane protein required for colicin V production